MEKVRYAIIGFGGIAESRISKEGFACDSSRFKPLVNAKIIGATDLNLKKQKTVESLGLKYYSSCKDILLDPNVDAVCITTNNSSHAKVGLEALEAGKHCFIEKPIATSIEDAQALSKLAKEKELSLAVDHMMVYNEYSVKVKQLIAEFAIGEVNDITLHMEFLYGSTSEEAKTWRCSKSDELGGPIGDVASHCFYMAESLLDSKIASLSSVYTPRTLDIAVENGAFINFTLQNGISGSIRVGFNANRGGLESTLSNLGYEIFGTKGTIRTYGTLFQLSGHSDEPVAVRLELDTFKKQENILLKDPVNIYQSAIMHHADSILSGNLMDGREGLENLKLIFAAHESAKNSGKKINL